MVIGGRVTERSIHARVLANLQQNLARGEKIQDQLSSGKQLNRPSDSPTGTVSSMQLRTESRANEQYVRNADDALGWLGTLESTLSGASTLVNRARDLTVQGLNTAINSPQSNAALATEIEQIRESMITYANTRYLDRLAFAGTADELRTYESDGTYNGDAGVTRRTVAPGESGKVEVSLNGPDVFGGTDIQSVFDTLEFIARDLRAGDHTALTQDLTDLDKNATSLKTAISEIGSRYNRITHMRDSAQARVLSVTSQLSEIEDIDLPKAIMEMQLQQTSYQAALAASAKVIQPSLIDFLR